MRKQLGVWRRIAAVTVFVLALWTGGSEAQRPLSADGRRDLEFGTVIRGVPTTIGRFDIWQAGMWVIVGERGAEVRIDLTLPTAMLNASGAALPLQFGANDGGYASLPLFFVAQSFDPRLPLITTIQRRRLYIFLGGTALPDPMQAAGTYAATISLTVSYTGN